MFILKSLDFHCFKHWKPMFDLAILHDRIVSMVSYPLGIADMYFWNNTQHVPVLRGLLIFSSNCSAANTLGPNINVFTMLVIQEAALSLGYLTAEEFDEWVDPKKMLGPSD